MEKKEGCSGAEQDFIYWRQPTNSIANELIKVASNYGVYDITQNDLVDDNPAFKQLYQICCKYIEDSKAALLGAMDDFLEGYDRAYVDASKNITGPGFGIITNSLGSALLYEAISYNALRQQAKVADEAFRTSLKNLHNSNKNKMDSDSAKILTAYYTAVKETIPSIVSYMIEVFFLRLSGANVIKLSEIQQYSLKDSSSILNNYDLVDAKEEVLYTAFGKCPFNADVYKKAIHLGPFNMESYKTAEYLHQDAFILPFLEKKCRLIIEKGSDTERLSSYIEILAYAQKEPVKNILKKLMGQEIQKVLNDYSVLREAINDENKLKTWIKENIEKSLNRLCEMSETDLSSSTINAVYSILPVEKYTFYKKMNALETWEISYSGTSNYDSLIQINNEYSQLILTKIKALLEFIIPKKALYDEAESAYKNEVELLSTKKNELLDKRKSLSFISFGTKKEIDREIASIDELLVALPLKHKLIQLRDAYKENW
ncbi:MAG: hypothetical protein E7301_11910 [Butyrivibrio sp.]|nr:hypothetical protein [Butyrivibrio sp.]